MSNKYVKDSKTSWLNVVIKVILITVISSFLVGFKNANRIEHSSFVTAIGIDKSPTDPNKILVTFQLVPPQVTSQSSIDIEKVFVTSINEDSLEKAFATIHNYVSTTVNLSHTRALIISETLAKDGILKYVNSIASNGTFDTNMFILISKETASSFLESFPKDTELNPITYYNILRNSQYISSSTKTMTVMQFLKDLYDPYIDPTAPLCGLVQNSDKKQEETTNPNDKPEDEKSKSSDKSDSEKSGDSSKEVDNTKSSNSDGTLQKSNITIEIGGMAIFQDDKLVGKLSSDETAYHIMLNSKLKSYFLQIDYIDKKTSEPVVANMFMWQESSANVNVNVNSDIPNIHVKIPLNISVLDTTGYKYDFYSDDYIIQIKDELIRKLEKNIYSYINKVQKEYNVDVDNFISYAKSQFLTKEDIFDYGWKEKYPKSNIQVEFEVKFVASGLSTRK